jgi:hypothetical protein
MTPQQQILDIAARMGANPKEVELAIALVRTGDATLIVQVMAAKLTIKTTLAKAAQKPPHALSQQAAGYLERLNTERLIT